MSPSIMHRVLVVLFLIGCSGEAALKQVEAEMTAEETRLRAEVEAKAMIERLQRDLAETDKKIEAAIDTVIAAQTENDRGGAMANLNALRREKAQLESTIAARKAELHRAKRSLNLEVSRECADNPLAKGCF